MPDLPVHDRGDQDLAGRVLPFRHLQPETQLAGQLVKLPKRSATRARRVVRDERRSDVAAVSVAHDPIQGDRPAAEGALGGGLHERDGLAALLQELRRRPSDRAVSHLFKELLERVLAAQPGQDLRQLAHR